MPRPYVSRRPGSAARWSGRTGARGTKAGTAAHRTTPHRTSGRRFGDVPFRVERAIRAERPGVERSRTPQSAERSTSIDRQRIVRATARTAIAARTRTVAATTDVSSRPAPNSA